MKPLPGRSIRLFFIRILGLLLGAGLFVHWQQPAEGTGPDELFRLGMEALHAEKIDSAHLFFDAARQGYAAAGDAEKEIKAAYFRSRLDNRNAHLQFDTARLDSAYKLALQKLPSNHPLIGTMLIGRGIHFFWKTPYTDSAEVCFRRAKDLFAARQDWDRVAEASFYTARVHGKRDDRERQWDELQYAIDILRRHVPRINFWTGEILYYTASRYLNRLDPDTAQHYLNEAKEIHFAIKEWNSYLKTCNYLAEYSLEKQRFDDMKRHLDDAAECVRQNPAWERRMQEIHQYYGKYYSRIGDYEGALESYARVFDFVVEDSLYIAYHLYSMGNMLLEKNALEEADSYLQNALIHARRHNQEELFPVLYSLFGIIDERQGAVLSALESHRTALALARRLIAQGKDDYNEGLKSIITSNLSLSRIFLQADLLDSAYVHLEENRRTHERYPYMDYATYGLWGEWYSKQKRYEDAIKALQTAIGRCRGVYGRHHPDVADLFARLGDVYQKLDNPLWALAHYQLGLNALDASYSTSDLDKNPDIENVSALQILRRLLVSKAAVIQDLGYVGDAYSTIVMAIRAIERLQTGYKTEGSKLFARRQALPTYEQAIELAHLLYDSTRQERYLEQAFRYAEQNKALLLLEALSSDQAQRFGEVPDSLAAQEAEWQRNLSFYKNQLAEAKRTRDTVRAQTAQTKILEYKTALEKLQKRLEREYPKYYEAKYSPRLASVTQVRERLPDGGQMIAYFVGNEGIYGFGIDRDSAVFFRQSKSDLFEKQISNFYNSVSSFQSDQEKLGLQYREYLQMGDLLYERYVQPLLLPGNKRLIIIPDDQLNYVAFDALLTRMVQPSERPHYRDLPFLLNDYSVHYHYSASLWTGLRQSGRNRGKVLAMAASYDSLDWQRTENPKEQSIRRHLDDIPGTVEEVRLLGKNFQGDFFVGAQTSEKRFIELASTADYSVIHLAMHGLLDKRQPANSGLVFTKTADTLHDDLVYVHEMNQMNLNADLVVLSACETGYGKFEKGEGVLSIGRSFMYAGVPGLLTTFWPLNDQASPLLIADFYRNLGNRRPKDLAMHEAKLDFLRKSEGMSAHPFFWASFATVGDEAPMRLSNPIPMSLNIYLTVCFLLYFVAGWYFRKAPTDAV